MPRDTEAFLRSMNEMNERIAAREAEEEAKQKALQGDPVRLAHDKERREKWGQLRAIVHPRSRVVKARHVFGTSNMRPPT